MSVAMQIVPSGAQGFRPRPGLSLRHFKRIAEGGFGDGHNNYAHSMSWFDGKLYVGTTRSNLCMLRLQSAFETMPFYKWPVECPDTMDDLYKLDRCAQIWCFDPAVKKWEMTWRAPMIRRSMAARHSSSRLIRVRASINC